MNLVEQSIDRLFKLEGEPREFCEFNTEGLLRSAPKDRIEMLARGVQGGIYSPNEARATEGLDAVPYGDGPRVQAAGGAAIGCGRDPGPASGARPTASPAAPAVKDYAAAVQRDLDALVARSKRPERTAAFDRAAEPRVVRKVRANGLQQ